MIDKIIENLLLERNAEQVTYNTEEAIKEHKEQCDFLIALLEKEKGWIKCNEELPVGEEYETVIDGETYHKQVLVKTTNEDVPHRVAFYDGEHWFDANSGFPIETQVVKWMLIPKDCEV